MFRSREITENLKCSKYLTVLRPITFYTTQTWSLRKTVEQKMAENERKILRKIYEAHFNGQTNEWRKLHEDELQFLFQ